MDVLPIFEAWRRVRRARGTRGLAWFMANEFCQRFYASHGIVPTVIDKEGLGYYGICLDHVHCAVNGVETKALGRLTIGGDVENWLRGSPGDHDLELMQMCDAGVATDELIHRAIRHMEIPAKPAKSHHNCRHRRRGQAYGLLFSIATIVALRNEGDVEITNNDYNTRALLSANDPEFSMSEHLGGFMFIRGENIVLVSGDGRWISPGQSGSLWQRYMEGETPGELAREIEGLLK